MAYDPPTDTSSSFAAFVEQYRTDLVRAACRITADSAEAEDVVQDTLLALWRHWQSRPPDNPFAYAFRAVTVNTIKRRMRRRRTAPLEAASGVPAAPANGSDLFNPLELEWAITQLPLAQQVVVRMRYYLGMSLAQISKDLSISANTAASRCRYAIGTLRTVLHGQWHFIGDKSEINHGKED